MSQSKLSVKGAFLFALISFGLQLGFLVLLYNIFPQVYPGDSFLIVGIYLFNLLFAIALFPLISYLTYSIDFSKTGIFILYLILTLLVPNLVWAIMGEKIFIVTLINAIFKTDRVVAAQLFDFADPFICFIITWFLFHKKK